MTSPLLSSFQGPYVALDLETTTMSPATARIVELTLASLDDEFNVQRSFTQRLNPGSPGLLGGGACPDRNRYARLLPRSLEHCWRPLATRKKDSASY
jgi:DNA polymerase III epsilon subunit-like protein